jgi:hypothetical protein
MGRPLGKGAGRVERGDKPEGIDAERLGLRKSAPRPLPGERRRRDAETIRMAVLKKNRQLVANIAGGQHSCAEELGSLGVFSVGLFY